MKPISTIEGTVVPLDRANVDTDAIIPKQYLKSIKRSGFGDFLFDDWRYLDPGDLQTDPAARRPNPDFVLNDPHFADAQVLVARENFGCGSSREHAVWALKDYGFKAVIAPSFAEIFYNNCFKNGLLPIVLKDKYMDEIFDLAVEEAPLTMRIDLPEQTVACADGASYDFEIEDYRKQRLLLGMDDIALTLEHADAIRTYEAQRAKATPWLF